MPPSCPNPKSRLRHTGDALIILSEPSPVHTEAVEGGSLLFSGARIKEEGRATTATRREPARTGGGGTG